MVQFVQPAWTRDYMERSGEPEPTALDTLIGDLDEAAAWNKQRLRELIEQRLVELRGQLEDGE